MDFSGPKLNFDRCPNCSLITIWTSIHVNLNSLLVISHKGSASEMPSYLLSAIMLVSP